MKVKPSVALEIIRGALRAKAPVLLVGPPGSGKTDITHLACEQEGQELLEMHPAVSDPTDFKGQPYVLAGQADFLPYGEMRKIIEAKIPTLCFFDDYGHAPISVQAATMHLLLARRIGELKVSDQVTFAAATNLRKHKAGVTTIIEPVKSRFVTIIELEQDLKEWIDWAIGANLPMEIIACIRFRPQLLTDPWQPAEDDTNSCSPRTIAHAGRIFSWSLSEKAAYAAIVGAAGEGFATEFFGFLRFWRNLPDPDEFLAHPDATPLPIRTNLGMMYALCGALAQRARRNTAEALVKIAGRLLPEFGVMLMSDCARKGGKAFIETEAFISWEVSHVNLRV